MHPLVRIARLAERQYSVFSRAQALAAGASARQIEWALDSGRWVRLHRNTYKITGALLAFEGRAMAAAMATSGWVSHETAGVLFELDRVPRGRIHVVVNQRRRVRIPGVIVHRPVEFTDRDRTSLGPIPVTTPQRTLLDLATVLKKPALEDALDSAIRKGLLDPVALRLRMDKMDPNGRRGFGHLLALLEERCLTAASESVLENDLRRVLRDSSIPMPTPQVVIRTPGGRFVARVDFAYPEQRLYLETDGYESRSNRNAWEAEVERQNCLAALGWLPLRLTKRKLKTDRDGVRRLIRETLMSRSGSLSHILGR